jgi:hypothetical protein
MARLAIDDDMIIQFHPQFTVTRLHFSKIDVQVGAGNHAGRMLFRGAHIDQDKPLGARGGRLGEAGS